MRIPTLLILLFTLVQPLHAQEPAPDELVKEVAGNILELIDNNREHYKANPGELSSLVTDELLPLFDVERSARLILGRHGRGATPEQVKAFAAAMSNLLAERYADGLLEFKGRDQLIIMPMKGKNTDKLTRVQTRVQLESGAQAPVDYTFHKTKDGWKAFDVSVEGISYVITYRNQFGPQIQKEGIDAVIRKLEEGDVNFNE